MCQFLLQSTSVHVADLDHTPSSFSFLEYSPSESVKKKKQHTVTKEKQFLFYSWFDILCPSDVDYNHPSPGGQQYWEPLQSFSARIFFKDFIFLSTLTSLPIVTYYCVKKKKITIQ